MLRTRRPSAALWYVVGISVQAVTLPTQEYVNVVLHRVEDKDCPLFLTPGQL